jgi:hypothetical protein
MARVKKIKVVEFDPREMALAEKRQRIKQEAKRMIWVTFRKEGIHCYPQAGHDPSLATGDEYDVSFLGTPHRHIFHFNVGIQVMHNDRDIEFIQFKRWLEKLYQGTLELDNKSCEMISDDLYEAIASRYPDRTIQISVSEDGENGCMISYNLNKPHLTIAI